MEPIILASGSLRRQEFFKLLGLPFSIRPPLINEELIVDQDPVQRAEKLALKKAETVVSSYTDSLPLWVFGADTLIAVDNEIFGKAHDRESAASMLRSLSGREHRVITGMALYNRRSGNMDVRSNVSLVRFSLLSESEIEWYLETGEWQGVAGAYRIQGLAGCFIVSISGSYSSIVGLPLHDFYVMLRENAYPLTD